MGGWVGGLVWGCGFGGLGPAKGDTKARRLQGTERAYEGAHVGGQAQSVKDR